MSAHVRDGEKERVSKLVLNHYQWWSTATLRNLLCAALSSPQVLKEITARSYWHPNGFLKLILAQSSTGSTLRVHSWRQQKQQSASEGLDTDIHSHRWPFISFVLSGALDILEFTETNQCEDRYNKYICAPNRKGLYKLWSLGYTGLSCSNHQTVGMGEYYSIDTNILHQVFNRSQETITAVIQGPPTERSSLVFRKGARQSGEQDGEHPLRTDVQVELQRLLTVLDRSWIHDSFPAC